MLMGRLEGRPYGNIPLEARTLVPRVPCVPESGEAVLAWCRTLVVVLLALVVLFLVGAMGD